MYQCPCSDEDCAKVRILRQSNGEWETTSITARMDTTCINLLLSAVWRHDRVSSGRSASLCSDRVSRPTALVGTWKSAARALSHRLEDGARRLMRKVASHATSVAGALESSLHKSRNRCPPAAAKKARSLAALQRPQKAPTPARAAGVAETDRKTQLRHWPTAKIAPRYSRCNAFAAPRRSRRSRRPQKRCRTKPRSEAMRNAARQLRRCQTALSRL